MNELATVVHPGTIRRWIRESRSQKASRSQATLGRPRTAQDIEKVILKLAKETGWGYCRILGELKKLGIESITRNTVKNIVKRNGFETGPKRGPGTWDEFFKRHAASMWQCDFFSKKIVSKTGLRGIFVLVFLHVKSRQVYISPSTYKPDESWMIQQADAFERFVKDQNLKCKIVMHDNDGKYSKPFLSKLKSLKIKPHRTAIRSPNTVAVVERFIQSIGQECLDHFIVFGHKHMDVLCSQYRDHYHAERPHQGLDNELIERGLRPKKQKTSAKSRTRPNTIRLGDIHCHERLGGLLKSYSRKAA